MLYDYEKILLEEHRRDSLFCVVVACVENGRLQVHREDCREWELNRHTGIVECDYYVDETNTDKLCKLFGVGTSAELIDAIDRNCKSNSGIIYTGNFCKLCDDNGVGYEYRIWY